MPMRLPESRALRARCRPLSRRLCFLERLGRFRWCTSSATWALHYERFANGRECSRFSGNNAWRRRSIPHSRWRRPRHPVGIYWDGAAQFRNAQREL